MDYMHVGKGVKLTVCSFVDVPPSPEEEQQPTTDEIPPSPEEEQQPTTDEIDDKTEIGNTPKVVEGNETKSDKCVTEDEKEESTESSPDTVRASTPVDTSIEVKAEVTDDKTKTPAVVEEPSKSSGSDSEDNLIDVEDSDDYLLHLETILKTIHARFYSYYEEHEKVNLLTNGSHKYFATN